MVVREDVFQEAMSQGHSAAWDQNWEKAAEYYRKAVAQQPQSLQAINSLGLALYELQRFDDALKVYQLAARIAPNDPLPIEKQAQIYERTGKLPLSAEQSLLAADLYLKLKDADKAVENWARVTRLQPEHLKAHSRLALVHERLGHTQQAITEYLAVASLLQDKGQLEEAAQTVDHAVQLNPDSQEARQALQLVKQNKSLPKPRRQRGATAPLRMARVMELEPPEVEHTGQEGADPIGEARQKALTSLAGLLFDFSAADKTDIGSDTGPIGSARKKDPRDDAKVARHLGLAIDLQTRGKDKEAAREMSRAVAAGLELPSAYFNLGYLLFRLDDKDEAVRNIQRSVQHADYGLAARLLIAQYYRERGQINVAIQQYLEALKLADAAVIERSQVENLHGAYEPLIETFSQETDLAMLDQVCMNIIELVVRPNWRAHLKQAREQLPPTAPGSAPVPLAEIVTQAKSPQVVEAVARINAIARQGFYRSAMEEAFAVIQTAPTYLPLHIQMGEILIREGRMPEAISKFSMVAQAYSARGEANRAINLLRRVSQAAPLDVTSRNRLIDQLIAWGKIDDALAEYVNLADVYYRLAELDAARATYEKALRLASQSRVERAWAVQVLHHMADIDLQKLDWRKALRVYEQLRTLEPEDEVARTHLVELNVRMGQNGQAASELDNYLSYLAGTAKQVKAISFLELMAEQFPELVFVHQRLAQFYQQAGRTAEAVERWDKVGDMLVQLGDREGAKEAIRAILVLNPPNVEDYRKFLQTLGG